MLKVGLLAMASISPELGSMNIAAAADAESSPLISRHETSSSSSPFSTTVCIFESIVRITSKPDFASTEA